jgi:hypothetical protein
MAMRPITPIGDNQNLIVHNKHPDAHLLYFGAELEKAWQKEKAVASGADKSCTLETAMDWAGVIADEISKTEAHTEEGLDVKLKALEWCFDGEPVRIAEEGDIGAYVHAHSIISSLLAQRK